MRLLQTAAVLLAIAPAALAPAALAQTPAPRQAPPSATITPAPGPATITPAPAAPGTATITPAQPGVASAPPVIPSEEAMREARQLTDLLGVPTQVRNTLTQVRNQVVQATIQASGKPVEEAIKIVDELLMPEFAARTGELQTALTLPWAQNFTISELKELRTFYDTPIGRKVLQVLPTVNQAAIQAGQQWSQRVFREGVAKHADELRNRGLKF